MQLAEDECTYPVLVAIAVPFHPEASTATAKAAAAAAMSLISMMPAAAVNVNECIAL